MTVGEILVEIMRKEVGVSLYENGDFQGPFPSGAPAIFADAVARLGQDSGIVGGVGDDDFGRCCIDRLEGDGVDTSAVEILEGVSTGVAFVTYFLDGSRKFIYHIENAAAGKIDKTLLDERHFEGMKALHINGSSLLAGERMREVCYKAVDLAKEKDALVSFDPNVRVELGELEEIRRLMAPVLEEADIVIPSGRELQAVVGVKERAKAVEKLLDREVELIVLKKGDKGCEIYSGEEHVEVPPFSVREVDPTGAGDAFSAAIVVGTIEGMPLEVLGNFANATGAKAVTAKGPMEGLARREEIDDMLERRGFNELI